MPGGLRWPVICFSRREANPGKVGLKNSFNENLHSPGWRGELWGGMWGPKIPRGVHQGQLTDGLDEEDNFWTHCVGQQLSKDIEIHKKNLDRLFNVPFPKYQPLLSFDLKA